jgi:hypothetical protein
MAMVRELADRTGLSAQVTAALADTYVENIVKKAR